VIANAAPTADAGADQTVGSGASFTLSAAASTDPDGDALSFVWRDATNVVIGTGPTLTHIAPSGVHVHSR
jgi:hypothetical protein